MLETKHAARRDPAPSALPVFAGRADAAAVRILPAASRFSLRLRPALADERGEAAGFRLDQGINRAVSSSGRASLRLGPDEWLLIGPEADTETIAAEVEAALAGHFHALVDISHRNVAFEVSGRHALDVLNAGCPLDLSDGAFPAGAATRTVFTKAEIVLTRPTEALLYRVECWRSFAAYLGEFLAEAAAEFASPLR